MKKYFIILLVISLTIPLYLLNGCKKNKVELQLLSARSIPVELNTKWTRLYLQDKGTFVILKQSNLTTPTINFLTQDNKNYLSINSGSEVQDYEIIKIEYNKLSKEYFFTLVDKADKVSVKLTEEGRSEWDINNDKFTYTNDISLKNYQLLSEPIEQISETLSDNISAITMPDDNLTIDKFVGYYLARVESKEKNYLSIIIKVSDDKTISYDAIGSDGYIERLVLSGKVIAKNESELQLYIDTFSSDKHNKSITSYIGILKADDGRYILSDAKYFYERFDIKKGRNIIFDRYPLSYYESYDDVIPKYYQGKYFAEFDDIDGNYLVFEFIVKPNTATYSIIGGNKKILETGHLAVEMVGRPPFLQLTFVLRSLNGFDNKSIDTDITDFGKVIDDNTKIYLENSEYLYKRFNIKNGTKIFLEKQNK